MALMPPGINVNTIFKWDLCAHCQKAPTKPMYSYVKKRRNQYLKYYSTYVQCAQVGK